MILILGFKFAGVHCASCRKSRAGVILALVEHDWLKWSHDENYTQRHNELGFVVRVRV